MSYSYLGSMLGCCGFVKTWNSSALSTQHWFLYMRGRGDNGGSVMTFPCHPGPIPKAPRNK